MSKKLKNSLAILLCATVLFGGLYYIWLTDRFDSLKRMNGKVKIDTYKTIPNFPIILANDTVVVESGTVFKNRRTVLLYFDPYCPFCRKQIMDIINHRNHLGSIDFIFVTPFPKYQMNNIYNEFGLGNYSNITVCQDTKNFLYEYFKISHVPYLAFFENNKILKNIHEGNLSYSQIIDTFN